MIWHRYVYMGSLGLSVGWFATGMWKYDTTRLSIAFVFLSLAWTYREMYLGWNKEKKSWKFVDRIEGQDDSNESTD